jgi:hypothetical protein
MPSAARRLTFESNDLEPRGWVCFGYHLERRAHVLCAEPTQRIHGSNSDYLLRTVQGTDCDFRNLLGRCRLHVLTRIRILRFLDG